MEAQRQKLREREEVVTSMKRQLGEERKRLERERGQQTGQLRSEYEAKVEVER